MRFHAYRDLASISFVRCTSSVPGADYNAEGTSFSLKRAIEKCRSEVIERTFHRQLTSSEKARLVGIAAHPEPQASERHAWEESLETFFLEQLASEHPPQGVKIPLWGGGCIVIARIEQNWISLFCFAHDNSYAIVQAVSKSLLFSLLKSWTELRNIKIYRPAGKNLSRYTKGNLLLEGIAPELRVRPGLKNNMAPGIQLTKVQQMIGKHCVTYYRKENL
jgi:hypothetical protein